MQPKSGKPPRSARLATTGMELSRAAQVRLAWMDFYRRTQNVALTCRHFGISRQTFYRWLKRYEPMDLSSLESGSHRPHRCRRPTWSFLLEGKVLTLRLQYPRWGKDKMVVLLRRQGLQVSASMVGRILWHLKRQGRLVEAPRSGVKGSRRALRVRPYAVRKPKQYAASRPGDLVEVDTMQVRPIPGMIFQQFTARDVISRWDVIQAHHRATAQSATDFLDTLAHRMPFPLRALQVDGGSEFAAEFEQACQQRGLHLFVLPPRSPNSTARSSVPTAPTPRSSIRSPPTRWN
ncbi:MAG: helix-turn-helix domain-containing protein [Terriglobales bacterium]